MLKRITLLLTLWALLVPAYSADRLLMARTEQAFPEAMLKLQETIKHHGYTVTRVQRVDIGLTSSGYKTDKYRVVFFGKPEQVRRMTRDYPRLIPYLPLKIAIFAEEEDTLMVSFSPLQLLESDKPQLNKVLEEWTADLQSMLDEMRSNP